MGAMEARIFWLEEDLRVVNSNQPNPNQLPQCKFVFSIVDPSLSYADVVRRTKHNGYGAVDYLLQPIKPHNNTELSIVIALSVKGPTEPTVVTQYRKQGMTLAARVAFAAVLR